MNSERLERRLEVIFRNVPGVDIRQMVLLFEELRNESRLVMPQVHPPKKLKPTPNARPSER